MKLARAVILRQPSPALGAVAFGAVCEIGGDLGAAGCIGLRGVGRGGTGPALVVGRKLNSDRKR